MIRVLLTDHMGDQYEAPRIDDFLAFKSDNGNINYKSKETINEMLVLEPHNGVRDSEGYCKYCGGK